jgi:hypothetical protein
MTPISKSRWTPQVEDEPAILTHPTAVLVEEGRQCPRCHIRPVTVVVEGFLPHPIPIELCSFCSLDLIQECAAALKGTL